MMSVVEAANVDRHRTIVTHASGNGKRLYTWGEIATYLDVSVDTAKRWASRYSLPVAKHPGINGIVFAEVAALEQWARCNLRPARPCA